MTTMLEIGLVLQNEKQNIIRMYIAILSGVILVSTNDFDYLLIEIIDSTSPELSILPRLTTMNHAREVEISASKNVVVGAKTVELCVITAAH